MPVTTRFDKALLNLDAVHQTIKTRLTTWRYSRPNITSETLLLAQGENVAGIAGDDQRVAEKRSSRRRRDYSRCAGRRGR
jgi:hypothetical protein